jgi:hypothetical protein
MIQRMLKHWGSAALGWCETIHESLASRLHAWNMLPRVVLEPVRIR